ncbi:hypothetical protein PQG02_37095 (plasmid) [Nostoc sp. UHCC 0926]|nr:hypothetical protein PQG02_37095 [Nostoc sp. UHCC 0926]
MSNAVKILDSAAASGVVLLPVLRLCESQNRSLSLSLGKKGG